MKIVIVDDHPLVRRGLASVISMQSNLQFAGEATNGQEALLVIEEIQPDLVLIDLKLADESGLDIIKEARVRGFSCKFILLTSSASREDFLKAEEVLVDGYVLKEALPEELLFAIQLVHKGRKYYDPGLMEDKMRMSGSSPTDELTPKEKEVLIELGQGPATVRLLHACSSANSPSRSMSARFWRSCRWRTGRRRLYTPMLSGLPNMRCHTINNHPCE